MVVFLLYVNGLGDVGFVEVGEVVVENDEECVVISGCECFL